MGWPGLRQVALSAGMSAVREEDYRKRKGYCVACLKGTSIM